jgi:FkbM family methyltransferase
MSGLFSESIVAFYRWWHGKCHMKGAGRLINIAAPRLPGLRSFPLLLPNGETVRVDFTEVAAFSLLNYLMGDTHQESALVTAISKYLGEGDVFWDVGANAGVVSHHVRALRPDCRQHLFEPNPKLRQWAQTVMSGFPDCVVHLLALSDRDGTATLHIPDGLSTLASITPKDRKEGTLEVGIQIATADSLVFVEGYTPPKVIKVDTEGHEPEVFAGMTKIVAKYRPLIFFEHLELTDSQIQDFLPGGYSLATVAQTGPEALVEFDRNAGHNSVYFPGDWKTTTI